MKAIKLRWSIGLVTGVLADISLDPAFAAGITTKDHGTCVLMGLSGSYDVANP